MLTLLPLGIHLVVYNLYSMRSDKYIVSGIVNNIDTAKYILGVLLGDRARTPNLDAQKYTRTPEVKVL